MFIMGRECGSAWWTLLGIRHVTITLPILNWRLKSIDSNLQSIVRLLILHGTFIRESTPSLLLFILPSEFSLTHLTSSSSLWVWFNSPFSSLWFLSNWNFSSLKNISIVSACILILLNQIIMISRQWLKLKKIFKNSPNSSSTSFSLSETICDMSLPSIDRLKLIWKKGAKNYNTKGKWDNLKKHKKNHKKPIKSSTLNQLIYPNPKWSSLLIDQLKH